LGAVVFWGVETPALASGILSRNVKCLDLTPVPPSGQIVLPREAHSDGETDQKQTRSSTPGQTKKMTNVLRNVIAIAILTINGKGGVVVGFLADCWKEESPIIFVYSRRLRASV
jgi:hypothetical protein